MSEEINNLSNRVSVVETTLSYMQKTLSEIKVVLASIDNHIKMSISTDKEVAILKKEVDDLKCGIGELNKWKWKIIGGASVVSLLASQIINKFL